MKDLILGTWIGIVILVRVYLEGLCAQPVIIFGPMAVFHMTGWWVAVLTTLCIWTAWLKNGTAQSILQRGAILMPWIWIPPFIDVGRTHLYPYPAGDLGDYVQWMVQFMPTYVTTGQKIEIIGFFFVLGIYCSAQKRFMPHHGVVAVLGAYAWLSLYAWVPGWIWQQHDDFQLGLLWWSLAGIQRGWLWTRN